MYLLMCSTITLLVSSHQEELVLIISPGSAKKNQVLK